MKEDSSTLANKSFKAALKKRETVTVVRYTGDNKKYLVDTIRWGG